MKRIFFLSILFFGLLSSSVKSTRFRTNPNSISMFTTSFKHVELKKWADANPNLFQNGLVREDYVRIFSSAEYNKVTSIANQIADEHGFLVLEFQFPIIYQSLNNGRGVAQEIIQRTINQQLNYQGRWIVLCGYLNNSNLLDFDVMVKWEDGNGNVSGVDQMPATRRIAAEEFAEDHLSNNLQNDPYSLPDREYYVLSGVFDYFTPVSPADYTTDLIDMNTGEVLGYIKDGKHRIVIIKKNEYEQLLGNLKTEEAKSQAVTTLLSDGTKAYLAQVKKDVWVLASTGFAEFDGTQNQTSTKIGDPESRKDETLTTQLNYARAIAMASVLNRRDAVFKYYYKLNDKGELISNSGWPCKEINGTIKCFDGNNNEVVPTEFNYNKPYNGGSRDIQSIVSIRNGYEAVMNNKPSYVDPMAYVLNVSYGRSDCKNSNGGYSSYCYRNNKDQLVSCVATAYRFFYDMGESRNEDVLLYNSIPCQKVSDIRSPSSNYKKWSGRVSGCPLGSYGCEYSFMCDVSNGWKDGNMDIFDLTNETGGLITLCMKHRESDAIGKINEQKARPRYEDLH